MVFLQSETSPVIFLNVNKPVHPLCYFGEGRMVT